MHQQDHRQRNTLTIPARTPLHVAVVTTAPPRQCGIATFSSNLCAALKGADRHLELRVAAIEKPGSADAYAADVRWRLGQGDAAGFARLARELNRSDVDIVAIEHEFGLYGTWDGEYHDLLAPFLSTLEKPAVTTLHTVLPRPLPSQLMAVRDIAGRSAAVIVMTEIARRLLTSVYGVDAAKVRVIPHGVPPMRAGPIGDLRERLGLEGRTTISTFGLVDPRKGLEFMIEGMRTVAERHPAALYLILGRTHPELAAREGEGYRAGLKAAIARHGLAAHVRLVDQYLSEEDIVDYLAATDVYVTPYLDPDQITSGTLAYALGAGRAIVSTSYLHAAEALGEGRGLLVPFRDPDALGDAVLRIIGNPELRVELERNAREAGARALWPNVARATAAVLRAAAAAPARHPVPLVHATPTPSSRASVAAVALAVEA